MSFSRGGRGRGERSGRGAEGYRGRGGKAPLAPPTPFRGRTTGLVRPRDLPNGKKGAAILLETNYLRLSIDKLRDLRVFQYDVTVEPERFKRMFPQVMEAFRRENFPEVYPSYDGSKCLICSTKLPDLNSSVSYTREKSGLEPVDFKVRMVFVKEVDLSVLRCYQESVGNIREIQDAVQIISIILRSMPLMKNIYAGRHFYMTPTAREIDLSYGMELFYGLYQSPILAQRGPLINVNVLHKAFPKGKDMLDLICDICNLKELPGTLTEAQQAVVMEVIRDRKVEYTLPGKKTVEYSVNAFRGSALDEVISTGSETVNEYFAKKKNYEIKFPALPLLWVGSRLKEIAILIPVELCSLKRGQPPKRSSSENVQVVSRMIKETATTTDIRRDRIKDVVAEIGNYDNSPFIQDFGFKVGHEFELVNGRVLDPPSIQYKNKKQVVPSKGVWDIRNQELYAAVTVEKWATINLDPRVTPQQVHEMQTCLVKEAQRMGIKMSNPRNFINISGSKKHVQDIQTNFEAMKDYDLIVVILSDKSNYYSRVKHIAEVQIGCMTQCVLSKSIQRLNSSTITNLLLKINTKLNGTNHRLASRPDFLKGNVMVMGADVTHPSPQNRDKMPSFAAVTASHDESLFKYHVICQLQLARQEIIVGLKDIVLRHLVYYHKQMKCLPDHILFFRDGVSEGQFDVIREAEVQAIKQACNCVPEKLRPNYKPKVTFIVVMKRHHTRFFPTSAEDTCDRNHNVKAGTCVDNGITHPDRMELMDFFLASHSAVQGVTKPTKYCRIYDDAGLSYDNLEEITYYLCHMYSRCTRSVSYPTPTYYAHLAAERAKKLYENTEVDFDRLSKEEKIPITTKLSKTMPMSFV